MAARNNMQSLPPEDYPITGLCVVADPTKCPHGYEVIYHSYDKKDECDLWKDSIFKSKVTRYLCFTRVFPLEGGRLNCVLADIVLNMERELPPADFSLVDFTIDSREKATRKKQICVKMLPRETCNDAICELILLSRSKRPPPGYTLAGEMNGLLICFKMGPVPPETQNARNPQQTTMNSTSQPTEPYNNSSGSSYGMEQPAAAPALNAGPPFLSNSDRTLSRQDTLLMLGSALSGVPFQLNPKYQNLQSITDSFVPEIQFRSIVDIEGEFNYGFRVEKSAANRIPTGLE